MMIIKKITVNNIRSYRDQTEIEIPLGITLFQGDIGCGKSTILSAIEFALFGLGDIDGNNLLRSGEPRGTVEIEIQILDKVYKIFRSLSRRNNKVFQDEGYIIDESDTRTTYSVNEMKSVILRIININERPQAKTTSLIYRFAIFTPQEMMKQILSEIPEKRLEILRRAFNIEGYNTVKRNAELLISWTRGEGRISQRLSSDLQHKETILQEYSERRDLLLREIGQIEKFESNVRIKMEKIRIRIVELRKIRDFVVHLETSIPHIGNAIRRNESYLRQLEGKIETFNAELDLIKEKEEFVGHHRHEYDNYLLNREKMKQLENSIKEHEQLERDKIRIESSIGNERMRLDFEITSLSSENENERNALVEYQRSVRSLSSLKERAEKIKRSLESLQVLRIDEANVCNKISRPMAEIESIENQMSRKQKEVDKIDKLGTGALCPTCKQHLNKLHITKIKNEYMQERSGMEEHITYLRELINVCNAQISKIRNSITKIENTRLELAEIEQKVGMISEMKNSIHNATRRIDSNESEIKRYATILRDDKYATDERKRLSEITARLILISKDKEQYETASQRIQKYDDDNIGLQFIETLERIKRKPTVEHEINMLREQSYAIVVELDKDRKELSNYEDSYEKNRHALEDLISRENDLIRLEDEVNTNRESLSAKRTEIKMLQSNLELLEKEINDKKAQYSRTQMYRHLVNWLEYFFIPAVEDIEKFVLQSIHEEFNRLFQQWFYTLMESEEIDVEVDDSFDPLITQNGYLLNVNGLSGGEKTSVALAYRLTLNTMIKRLTGMNTTLIIFDEPTDGFGKEQLFRLGHILNELNCTQAIIVSHEHELEGFADHVFRINKENNKSKIAPFQSKY
jgi:exonuclease SbcC